MKPCEYEKVCETLYLWFTRNKGKGVQISGTILNQKALQFCKVFNEGDPYFAADIG